MFKKTACLMLLMSLCVTSSASPVYAQVPTPVVPSFARNDAAVSLRGISLDKASPGTMDIFLKEPSGRTDAAERLINYFFAALTIPENDIWVNLSPYEADRMIPGPLSLTELGRDLLQQDYELKQLAAGLTDPSEELGRSYWRKAFPDGAGDSGSMNSICKVWIVPRDAQVVETPKGVFIENAGLDVMMDRDYAAMFHEQKEAPADDAAVKAYREIIVPVLRDKVNSDPMFAPVREIYHAVILALWYKARAADSELSRNYTDRRVISGIDHVDRSVKGEIYRNYSILFDKGVVNRIYEDTDPLTGDVLPRKYFSGGCSMGKVRVNAHAGVAPAEPMARYRVRWDAAMAPLSQAVFRPEHQKLINDLSPIRVLRAAASGLIGNLRDMGYSDPRILSLPGNAMGVPVVDVGPEALSLEGAPVIGVFPGGVPGLEMATFFSAAGRVEPQANVILISPYNGLKRGGPDGRELFVQEALFFDRNGRLVIGRFKAPLRIDGLVPGGIRNAEFRQDVEPLGVPLLETQELVDMVEDKGVFNKFLQENGNTVAPFIEIDPTVSRDEVARQFAPFIDGQKIDQLVVKPANGSQGIGVRMFAQQRREEILGHIQSIQAQGRLVIIQRRNWNSIWPDPKTGAPVDWNLRVCSVWKNGRLSIVPEMIYVRYKTDNFQEISGPVSASQGGGILLFSEFARQRGLSEADMLQGIKDEVFRALDGIEKKMRAIPGGHPAGFIGWDLMLDQDGKWTIIEANAGPVGIVYGVSGEKEGAMILPIINSMAEMAAEYQKSRSEPTAVAPEGLMAVALPKDDFLAGNMAGLLGNIKQTEDAEALERLAVSVNSDSKTLASLGRSLVEQGDLEEGIDVLQQSLAMDPLDLDVLHDLVYGMRKTGVSVMRVNQVYENARHQNKDPRWRLQLIKTLWIDVLADADRALREFLGLLQEDSQISEQVRLLFERILEGFSGSLRFSIDEIADVRRKVSVDGLQKGIEAMIALSDRKRALSGPVESLADRLKREKFETVRFSLTPIANIDAVRGRFMNRDGDFLAGTQAMELLDKGILAYTDGHDVVFDNAMGGVDLTAAAFRHARIFKDLHETGEGSIRHGRQSIRSLTPVILERILQ